MASTTTRPPTSPPDDEQPQKPDALAKRMPDWLAAPLAKYVNNPAFDLVLPSMPVNAELGYAHRLNVSVVTISPNPDDKEVFKVGTRKAGSATVDVFAYSKAALEKMAEGAGIHINTNRIDDRKDHDYCEIKATAAMRNSSGQPVIRSATKAFYMPAVAEEAWRNRIARRDFAKSKGWENGKKTDDELKPEHDAEMSSFKKYLLARTESGAMLRVIRNLLAIKSGLTAEQIAKPKVLVRVDFQPDPNDPVARHFMLEQGQRAMLAIYGPTTSERVSSAEVIEEPDDPETIAARAGEAPPAGTSDAIVEDDGQSALPLGTPPPAGDSAVDYEALIFEGCRLLGVSKEQRAAMFAKHNGDLRAIYLEVSNLGSDGVK